MLLAEATNGRTMLSLGKLSAAAAGFAVTAVFVTDPTRFYPAEPPPGRPRACPAT